MRYVIRGEKELVIRWEKGITSLHRGRCIGDIEVKRVEMESLRAFVASGGW